MSETETILNKIDSLAIELQKLELIFEAYKKRTLYYGPVILGFFFRDRNSLYNRII